MKRLILAFLLAPFPVAIFQAIVVGIWPKPGQGVFDHPPSMFVAMLLYFYLAGAVLGTLLALLGRVRSHPTATRYSLVGLFAGGLPVAVALASLASRGQFTAYTAMYDMMLFAGGGAITALTFRRYAYPKAA